MGVTSVRTQADLGSNSGSIPTGCVIGDKLLNVPYDQLPLQMVEMCVRSMCFVNVSFLCTLSDGWCPERRVE